MYCIGGLITALSSGLTLIIPQAFQEIGNMQELRIQPNEEKRDEIEKQNQEVKTTYRNFIIKWSAICFASGILGYYRRYFNTNLTNRISIRLRNTLYQNFLSQNLNLKNIHSSELVHKLSNDVSLVSWGLTMDLVFGLRGLFFVLGGSSYLLMYAQPLVPPAIVMMLVLGYSTK